MTQPYVPRTMRLASLNTFNPVGMGNVPMLNSYYNAEASVFKQAYFKSIQSGNSCGNNNSGGFLESIMQLGAAAIGIGGLALAGKAIYNAFFPSKEPGKEDPGKKGVETRVDNAAKSISEADKVINQCKTDSDYSALSNTYDSLNLEYKTNADKISELTTKNTGIDQKATAQVKEADEGFASATKAMEEPTKNLDLAKKAVPEAKTGLTAAKSGLSKAEGALATAQSANPRNDAAVAQAQTAVATAKKAVADAEEKLKKAEADLPIKQEAFDKAEAALKKAQKAKEAAAENRTKATDEMSANNKIADQLKSANGKVDEKRTEVKVLMDQHNIKPNSKDDKAPKDKK